jgi:acetylornithine/N-succinyldiaminopimelate aminotransferase
VTSGSELRARFEAALMPNYGTPPIALTRGEGCRVWDADGRSYLDLIAGIAVSALGHGHPALVKAVSEQVTTLAHTSNLFVHERAVELAERLIALLRNGAASDPGDIRVFFANSGAEANEAALKLVRRAAEAGRTTIVSESSADSMTECGYR